MATFKRFEEMRAWQSARELVMMVYDATRLPVFRRDFALRDQIRRAVISGMSNIAEGFGASSDAEFIRFLGYARRSISEVQSQLYAATDQQYISSEQFEEIYAKANLTERQVNALIGFLKRQRVKKVEESFAPYEVPDCLSDLSDIQTCQTD